MEVRIEKLFPASFRGIVFFVNEEQEPSLGRKIVIHDYPNSGKRFAQDLGPIVGTFNVEGLVTGNNFIQLADNLKEVLNREGEGRLVLPNIGALDVVSLPYNVDYSHKKIGIVVFSLKFTLSNVDEIPAVSVATIQDVFQSGDEARLEIQNQFKEIYQVPQARKDVLTAIADYEAAIIQTVDQFGDKVLLVTSRIQNIVSEVQSTAAILIRDPVQLAEKLIFGAEALINGLFAVLSQLLTDPTLSDEDFPKITANIPLDLTEFGADLKDNGTSATVSGIPIWPADTANRNLRNRNRLLMVESVRLNSLIIAYEVAANFDYQTSKEITAVIDDLENSYLNLILIGDPDLVISNDEDIKLAVDAVKNAANDVLAQKAQQVFTVTDLKFQGVNSVMNLTYKLYKERIKTTGDLEELAELFTNLNPDINPLEMTGDLVGFES